MTSLIKEYYELLGQSKILGDFVDNVPLIAHDWGYSYDFDGYLTCCLVDNGDGTISEYVDCNNPDESHGATKIGTPQQLLDETELHFA